MESNEIGVFDGFGEVGHVGAYVYKCDVEHLVNFSNVLEDVVDSGSHVTVGWDGKTHTAKLYHEGYVVLSANGDSDEDALRALDLECEV